MHPKYNISRGYLVRVLGNLPDDKLQVKHGIELEDGGAAFKEIHKMEKRSNQWFYVSLQEGRRSKKVI